MFAWGCGPCLGTGSVDATSARPKLIDELQSTSVIDIAAGDSHCLALSKGWCQFQSLMKKTRWIQVPSADVQFWNILLLYYNSDSDNDSNNIVIIQ